MSKKNWIKSFFIASVFLLSSCNNTEIIYPTINNTYTDNQTDSLISQFRIAQHRDISFAPNPLQLALIKDFPKCSDIDWEVGNNIYRAEFEIGSYDFKAYYDTNGTLLMYKTEIKEHELPAIVKNTAIALYPDFNFEDLEKIVIGTRTYYEIEMERNKDDIKFVCNSDGSVINEYITF